MQMVTTYNSIKWDPELVFLSMLGGVLVTMSWHTLGLWIEEMASSYEG
jgi:hypothetical protein